MSIYGKNLDHDIIKTREFFLIGCKLQELNSEIRQCGRFSDMIAETLVCRALDYVWDMPRKRGNILGVYVNDIMIRCHQWELDRFADGMASAFSAAYYWFRWEGNCELVLVNWLCRNNIDIESGGRVP